jgi:6,7-dimethyl-8-ribityllumazine synthase
MRKAPIAAPKAAATKSVVTTPTAKGARAKSTAHLLLVEARFYDDIGDLLAQGAISALEAAGASYERISIPGALEAPAAIRLAQASGRFDGYVALGCIIRGETYHFEVVCNESARGLMMLGLAEGLAIGNGILTVNTMEQALDRALPTSQDKGGGAAQAALALIDIRRNFAKPVGKEAGPKKSAVKKRGSK